jgi:formylmethanofuran dehydrogenase subunit C
MIAIDGDAGERIGDRMRRGLVLVRGRCGRWAGSRMMGGTILARGGFDAQAGALMRRGTLIGSHAAEMLPTFADCGVHDLNILRLLGAYLKQMDAADILPEPTAHRLQGDMATIGRGEILITRFV